MAQHEQEHECEHEYKIVGGPGKFDLMIAMFKQDEPVTFCVKELIGDQSNVVITCTIMQMKCKSRSNREEWIIDGSADFIGPDRDHQEWIHRPFDSASFHADYSMRKTSGSLFYTIHKG